MTAAGSPIIVIGGGIGGLSTAIRLAAAGKQVTVLEKNPEVGGKMGQHEADGFRWDTGPSVITMRHVFEDLFDAAGRRFSDYVTLQPIDPLARYFFSDGTRFDASAGMSDIIQEIEKLDERDVEGYLAYLSYAARIHRITGPVFIYNRPPSLMSFTKVPMHEWLKVDPFRTMHQSIRRHVRDPRLRQMLGRFATYVGGSPYEAPATLNVIAHVELVGGVWYPKGGIHQMAEGMKRLAHELGVQICTDTPVDRIEIDKRGHIQGVVTANGSRFETDTVVSNVDVTTTYQRLLPDTTRTTKRLEQLKDFEPSGSGFILLLGVQGQHDDLAHHNVFFSADYRAEFETIFKAQALPQDPTIYVAITSKADPDHAPDGCENWFVLINAPPTSEDIDWEQEARPYRDLVLQKLAEKGYDIRDKIISELILTPEDLKHDSGAWRGALYGPSANSKWTAFRRPHNRSRDVDGLYFAGGTTHPGGGVPMVALSGKVAADMILEDHARKQRE